MMLPDVITIGPGTVEFWYGISPEDAKELKGTLLRNVYELREFASLRSRRELGWARLRVTEGPVANERDRWSELKSLDDMSVDIHLVSKQGRIGATMAACYAYDCAKAAFRRKQRQAGVGRG